MRHPSIFGVLSPVIDLAPDAPILDSVTPGDAQCTVTFHSVITPDSHNLYWSTDEENWTKITGVTSPYVHTGRTNGTPYYYAVTAVKSGLESVLSNEGSGTPVTRYIVDLIGGDFIAAVSWRKVLSTFTGAVNRARESSANNEADCGLTGDDYDAADLTDLCGANNGFGTRWYTQAGAGYFGMNNAAYQSYLCESGVIVPGPASGRYASRHNETDLYWYGMSEFLPVPPFSFLMVGITDAITAYPGGFWSCQDGSGNVVAPSLKNVDNASLKLVMSLDGTKHIANNAAGTGQWMVITGVCNGANSVLRVNGTEVTGDVGTCTAKTIHLGLRLDGRLSEYLLQGDAAWSEATRIAAEANAKAYWGITW